MHIEVRQSSRPPKMGPDVKTILVSENIILRGIQKKTQFHCLPDQDRSGSGQILQVINCPNRNEADLFKDCVLNR